MMENVGTARQLLERLGYTENPQAATVEFPIAFTGPDDKIYYCANEQEVIKMSELAPKWRNVQELQ